MGKEKQKENICILLVNVVDAGHSDYQGAKKISNL